MAELTYFTRVPVTLVRWLNIASSQAHLGFSVNQPAYEAITTRNFANSGCRPSMTSLSCTTLIAQTATAWNEHGCDRV